jgi:phenylpropionate dioxygenase-like ring-hydroxylating dioxygenase large terminal subunit
MSTRPSANAVSASYPANLVQADRVHHSVYSDPGIFELEMTRLFGRAWLLLGHESQIPQAGDYVSTRMGREPVIMARHSDGSVQVLINRCTHRGALLVHEDTGNVKNFVCPYHGWVFSTDGALRNVPMPQGYGEQSRQTLDGLGLARVARSQTYRGFVFASLAEDGPGLLESLGPIVSSFDDLVDRAPDGEVEIAGGVFKHAYHGNWKLVLENHLDGVHPNYVHASSVAAARAAPDAAANPAQAERYAEISLRQMRQNGAPEAVWESLGIWTTAHGHGYMGDYHSDARLVAAMDHPVFAQYRKSLEARVGEAEAKRILSVSRFNTVVYPNVSFMSQYRQLRIVHPLAVDRTVVYTYNIRLKGAPAQMFRDTVAFSNVVNGTASWVLTDDLEVYERVQRGLTAAQPPWVYLGRGLSGEVDEPDGFRRGPSGTSEIYIRRQFQAWAQLMGQV